MATVRERYQKLLLSLNKAKETVRKVEVKIKQIQLECPHNRTKTWSDGGGYKPDWSSTYTECLDCGRVVVR